MTTEMPKFKPGFFSGLSEEKVFTLSEEDWFSPEIPQPASYEVIREPWGFDKWETPDGTECEETGGPLFRLTMPNGAFIDVWPSSGGDEFFDEWKTNGPDWQKWLEYVQMASEFSNDEEDFYYCFRDYALALAAVALSPSDLVIDTGKVDLTELNLVDNMFDPFYLEPEKDVTWFLKNFYGVETD